MKLIIQLLLLIIIISSCQEEDWTINSKGLVKLDQAGLQKDGWGVSEIVVSHDGKRVYYAAVNFQTSRFELRMIDESSKVKKLFSGDGFIDAIDISEDDNTLLYSASRNFGSESWLYEYPLNSRIQTKLLTVVGDGYFWEAKFLTENTILYSQGHGGVGLSLRKINRNTKEVTVLLDKSDNPRLVDIDHNNEKLLVLGWTDRSLRITDYNGTTIKDFGVLENQINPIKFSPDGSEILSMGSLASPFVISTIDIENSQRNTISEVEENIWPLQYGNDGNEIICMKGNSFPKELFFFDRNQGAYRRLTNNQLHEQFLGFYGNTSQRILFQAVDEAGQSAFYILNLNN